MCLGRPLTFVQPASFPTRPQTQPPTSSHQHHPTRQSVRDSVETEKRKEAPVLFVAHSNLIAPLNCPSCKCTYKHTSTHTQICSVERLLGGWGGKGRWWVGGWVGLHLSIRGLWRVVRVIIALGRGLPVCGCLLIRCGGGVASGRCVRSR